MLLLIYKYKSIIMTDNFLKNFWELVTFQKLPQDAADVRVLIQSEMMKFHSRAIICRVPPADTEKSHGFFMKDINKKYYCINSKLIVKEGSEIRQVIDFIVADDIKWGIETNLKDALYLVASWKHWGENI